jgi:hypothetical protein
LFSGVLVVSVVVSLVVSLVVLVVSLVVGQPALGQVSNNTSFN